MGQITVNQSHQVMAALITNTKWKEIDFEKADLQDTVIRDPKGAGRRFTEFLKNGGSAKKIMEHIVDCDAMPEILFDWQKEEHHKMGKIKLENRGGKLYANGKKVIRFLSENQQGGKRISSHKLLKELRDKPILNACILDYLLRHSKQLIPEEWKNGLTYFWGTIFRGSNGGPYVAYLEWEVNYWDWHYICIGNDLNDGEFTACLKSS